MFIDYFEIAFIVIPILAPVAEHMGIDLVWFGVMIAMNLQTSFLTPPFGYALFYLRSVAARSDYNDPVTRQRIKGVTTAQIYKGSMVFIVLQASMLVVVISFPGLVTSQLHKTSSINLDTLELQAETGGYGNDDADPMQGFVTPILQDKTKE